MVSPETVKVPALLVLLIAVTPPVTAPAWVMVPAVPLAATVPKARLVPAVIDNAVIILSGIVPVSVRPSPAVVHL